LSNRHLDAFREMQFYRLIEEQYGAVVISHDDLNWRIVRPGQANDVGPVHLDKWFWDGGYGTMSEGYDRFKIWIPIHSEPGANGLKIKPFSHTAKEWKHHFEMRDGINKPALDEREEDLNMLLLPLGPGEIVMFRDDMLHGGAVNRGTKCRVSIELTILFVKQTAAGRSSPARRRGELRTPESLHARRVRCSTGMGLPLLHHPPHLLDQLLLHRQVALDRDDEGLAAEEVGPQQAARSGPGAIGWPDRMLPGSDAVRR
jgi:hypothetical protein